MPEHFPFLVHVGTSNSDVVICHGGDSGGIDVDEACDDWLIRVSLVRPGIFLFPAFLSARGACRPITFVRGMFACYSSR